MSPNDHGYVGSSNISRGKVDSVAKSMCFPSKIAWGNKHHAMANSSSKRAPPFRMKLKVRTTFKTRIPVYTQVTDVFSGQSWGTLLDIESGHLKLGEKSVKSRAPITIEAIYAYKQLKN